VPPGPCPICESPAAEVWTQTYQDLVSDGHTVGCDVCGQFRVAWGRNQSPPADYFAERGRLRGVLHKWASLNTGRLFRPDITPETWKSIIEAGGAPADHSERVDLLVQTVARLAPAYGSETPLVPVRVWAARLYVLADSEFRTIQTDYESLVHLRDDPTGRGIGLRMRKDGWAHHRRLGESRADSRRIFLASWAGMDSVLLPFFLKAAEATGLEPVVGTKLAGPKGNVNDQIAAAIRGARLVVADFTGDRGGVYFEAGFAIGLGVPVVFSSSEVMHSARVDPEIADWDGAMTPAFKRVLWKDRLHFDTNHFPHLWWKDGSDFAEKVADRIRAWGLDLSPRPLRAP
jgi:hypothetical protein